MSGYRGNVGPLVNRSRRHPHTDHFHCPCKARALLIPAAIPVAMRIPLEADAMLIEPVELAAAKVDLRQGLNGTPPW